MPETPNPKSRQPLPPPTDVAHSPFAYAELDITSNFSFLRGASHPDELVYAADLVISLAGRSTMDESITSGTPGIFIPIKGHFEQEQGAARLGYKYEDIFRLEALIEEKMGHRNRAVDASGAESAAKIISSLR